MGIDNMMDELSPLQRQRLMFMAQSKPSGYCAFLAALKYKSQRDEAVKMLAEVLDRLEEVGDVKGVRGYIILSDEVFEQIQSTIKQCSDKEKE